MIIGNPWGHSRGIIFSRTPVSLCRTLWKSFSLEFRWSFSLCRKVRLRGWYLQLVVVFISFFFFSSGANGILYWPQRKYVGQFHGKLILNASKVKWLWLWILPCTKGERTYATYIVYLKKNGLQYFSNVSWENVILLLCVIY